MYQDEDFVKILDIIDNTSTYALTGSMCVLIGANL